MKARDGRNDSRMSTWECDLCRTSFWDTGVLHSLRIVYVQNLCPFCGHELRLIPADLVVVEGDSDA